MEKMRQVYAHFELRLKEPSMTGKTRIQQTMLITELRFPFMQVKYALKKSILSTAFNLLRKQKQAYDIAMLSVCSHIFPFKVIGRTVPRNNYLSCLFIFISPLHVSALAGHLQAEYTIFSGSYLLSSL
jgi:hypothetical protein